MISMTWIPEFIRGVAWVYIAVWVAAIVATWMVPKTLARRAVATMLVTVAFGVLPVYLHPGRLFQWKLKPVTAA